MSAAKKAKKSITVPGSYELNYGQDWTVEDLKAVNTRARQRGHLMPADLSRAGLPFLSETYGESLQNAKNIKYVPDVIKNGANGFPIMRLDVQGTAVREPYRFLLNENGTKASRSGDLVKIKRGNVYTLALREGFFDALHNLEKAQKDQVPFQKIRSNGKAITITQDKIDQDRLFINNFLALIPTLSQIGGQSEVRDAQALRQNFLKWKNDQGYRAVDIVAAQTTAPSLHMARLSKLIGERTMYDANGRAIQQKTQSVDSIKEELIGQTIGDVLQSFGFAVKPGFDADHEIANDAATKTELLKVANIISPKAYYKFIDTNRSQQSAMNVLGKTVKVPSARGHNMFAAQLIGADGFSLGIPDPSDKIARRKANVCVTRNPLQSGARAPVQRTKTIKYADGTKSKVCTDSGAFFGFSNDGTLVNKFGKPSGTRRVNDYTQSHNAFVDFHDTEEEGEEKWRKALNKHNARISASPSTQVLEAYIKAKGISNPNMMNAAKLSRGVTKEDFRNFVAASSGTRSRK